VVLAVIAIGLMRLAYLTGADHAALACLTLAELSMFLFFFNLLPIPPLDGSYLLKHLTGMSWEIFQQFSRFGIIVLIIVIQAQPVQRFLYKSTVISLSLIARAFGVAPRSHAQLGPSHSNRIVNTDWSYDRADRVSKFSMRR
jgi:Zn-dependent protease